jgi:type II secretory pathway component PulF
MANRTRYLPADETALFCEQVALLLKSGIPLYDGIAHSARTMRPRATATAFPG